MTTYEFRCRTCGRFDAAFPIGTAPGQLGCPECAAPSVKLIGTPAIGRAANGYSRAIERSAASADSPQVVTGSIPGSPRRSTPVTRHPLHARLPRP